MKIAIAASCGRTAARLDNATELVVIENGDEHHHSCHKLNISDWPPRGRADRLTPLGINTLVCGWVCGFDEAGFEATEIQLITGVAGPIEGVIRAVMSGRIQPNHDYWHEKCDPKDSTGAFHE